MTTPETKAESKPQRLDRELNELLQGLRVLLPGVQVLFAFLLTVPFSQGFSQLDRTQRWVFVSALTCAAIASALLVAPSTFHRILFRDRDKEWLVVQSNRLAIIGTVFLAVAMTCALYLVVEVVLGHGEAIAIAAAIGVIIAVLWYAVPYARRKTN
jgi:hypothetical protein